MPSELELIDAAFARIGDHAYLGETRAGKIFWLNRMRQAAVANADFYKHHLDDILHAYYNGPVYEAIARYDRAQQRRWKAIQGGDETVEAFARRDASTSGKSAAGRFSVIQSRAQQAERDDQMLRSDLMLI